MCGIKVEYLKPNGKNHEVKLGPAYDHDQVSVLIGGDKDRRVFRITGFESDDFDTRDDIYKTMVLARFVARHDLSLQKYFKDNFGEDTDVLLVGEFKLSNAAFIKKSLGKYPVDCMMAQSHYADLYDLVKERSELYVVELGINQDEDLRVHPFEILTNDNHLLEVRFSRTQVEIYLYSIPTNIRTFVASTKVVLSSNPIENALDYLLSLK